MLLSAGGSSIRQITYLLTSNYTVISTTPHLRSYDV